jgi:hypothetical protein
MRLIKGDKVFGFMTVWSLGYTVRGDKSATLERFREKVKGSLRGTQEWASLVKAKMGNLDVPRLLKLLASRPEPADSTDGNLDFFAEQICMRFAESQDPDLLSRALAVAKNHQGASILRRGFGTPKGREYLLGKVADAKEPIPARLRYADTFYEAGYVYRETITDITASSSRSLGKADEGNSAYLTRIAKLARANAKDEKLCLRLVR